MAEEFGYDDTYDGWIPREDIVEQVQLEIENLDLESELEADFEEIENNDKEVEDEIFRKELKRKQRLRNVGRRVQSRNRITPPYITQLEKARIIGKRADAIDQGAEILIDLNEHPDLLIQSDQRFDPIRIATREFDENLLHYMKIHRYMPDGTYEEWKLGELKSSPRT